MSWDTGRWRRSFCSERAFWDKYGPLGLDSTPRSVKGLSLLAGPLPPCWASPSLLGLSLLAGLPSCGSLKGQTNISQEREGSHRETIISFCCPRQFLSPIGLRGTVDSLSEGG